MVQHDQFPFAVRHHLLLPELVPLGTVCQLVLFHDRVPEASRASPPYKLLERGLLSLGLCQPRAPRKASDIIVHTRSLPTSSCHTAARYSAAASAGHRGGSLSGIPCTRAVRQSGQYLASFQSKLEADVPSLCGALGRQRRSDWSASLHRDGVMCRRSAGGGLHGQLGSPGSSQQLPQPTDVLTKRVASFEPLRKSARISLRCENLSGF